MRGAADGTRPRVLLVHHGTDDDFARTLLNGGKLDLVTCGAVDAARRLANPSLSAVILAEGARPAASLALLRDIKRHRPDLPVIYLAAKPVAEGAASAYRAGARIYMVRPVDPDDLGGTAVALAVLRSRTPGRRRPLTLPERRVATSPARTEERIPPGLRRAVEFMRRRLARPLSLDDLASEAAMSKYHFSRLFRAHFGSSPHRFLTGLRIERAKKLLLEGEHGISQVASLAGFGDASNFSKAFRRHTGLSPTFFRRRSRGDL